MISLHPLGEDATAYIVRPICRLTALQRLAIASPYLLSWLVVAPCQTATMSHTLCRPTADSRLNANLNHPTHFDPLRGMSDPDSQSFYP